MSEGDRFPFEVPDLAPGTPPATLVQLTSDRGFSARFGDQRPDGEMPGDLAVVLAAVLIAAAEQVAEKRPEMLKVSFR